MINQRYRKASQGQTHSKLLNKQIGVKNHTDYKTMKMQFVSEITIIIILQHERENRKT